MLLWKDNENGKTGQDGTQHSYPKIWELNN